MSIVVDSRSVSTVISVQQLLIHSTSCCVDSRQAAVRPSSTESSFSSMTTVCRDMPRETRSTTGQSRSHAARHTLHVCPSVRPSVRPSVFLARPTASDMSKGFVICRCYFLISCLRMYWTELSAYIGLRISAYMISPTFFSRQSDGRIVKWQNGYTH